MEAEINLLIDSVAETDSRNRLTVEQIRNWLSRYLKLHAEEVARFPELKGKPHLDIIAADFDLTRPALFIVGIFDGETVTLAPGLADAHALRTFLEQEAPEDVREALSELGKRFKLSDKQLTIERQLLEKWFHG